MELSVFEQELRTLTLLPEAIRSYACIVAAQLSPEKREEVLQHLREEYAEFKPFEERWLSLQDQTLARLAKFRKEEMPKIAATFEALEKKRKLRDVEKHMK